MGNLFIGLCFFQIKCLNWVICTSALMLHFQSLLKIFNFYGTGMFLIVATNTSQAFYFILSAYCFYRIVKMRSIPMEPPTDGISYWQNIPIRLSQRPPPEIEPSSVVLSVRTISQIKPVQQSSPRASERSNETFEIQSIASRYSNSLLIYSKQGFIASPVLEKTFYVIILARSYLGLPLNYVNLPRIVACSSLTPLVSTNYFLIQLQGCLSSLSIELQIVLNFSKSQLASVIIISKIFLWFTFTINSFTPTVSKISCIIAKTSASGIIRSYFPAISKSHWQNYLNLPLFTVGWSLRQTLPMWNLLIFWMLVLLAINLAKGTVKSYRSEHFYPPWSSRSQISFESQPYFPVRTSLSSKTGVSIQTPPCFLKTSTIMSITFLLMAIWWGWQSLVPLGVLISNATIFSFSSFFCAFSCFYVLAPFYFLSSFFGTGGDVGLSFEKPQRIPVGISSQSLKAI